VEAARTEAGQTPYRPLQAYMDEASVQKHVQPWQQALVFIARTQAAQQAGQERDGGGGREWLGRLPVYGMTPRQRQKWQVLWQLAMPPAPKRPAAAANTRTRVQVVHTFAGAGQIIEDVWDSSPSPSPSPGTSASASMVKAEEEADAEVDAEIEAWQMLPIKQACLEFCIELLNQRHHTHEYESALVCAMAVQGWGEARWRDPDSYPPILSRVIKIARFMVVQKALWLDPHARDIIYMWVGGRKPDANNRPVSWPLTSADDELVDINQGGQVTGSTARSPLVSGLGFGAKMLHDHVQQMVRSFMIRGSHGPMQGKQGWCFLQDTRTRWPVEGWQWLIQRLRDEPVVQRQFMRRGQMQAQLVAQYLTRVAWFKEKLVVAIHVMGGQPARAPELLSIQHVNTQASHHWNVFIKDRLVTLMMAYYKGFHASNNIKLIHQYMPRAVGELVVWYMWLVLPFTEQLTAWQAQQHQHHQPAIVLGLGLDPDPRQAGTPPRSGFGVETQARPPRSGLGLGLNHPLNPPPGTAAAAGPGLGLASLYLWGPDPGTQRAWTSDRFREVLKRETQARLLHSMSKSLATLRNI
jgi:hypothetical protein